MREGKAEIMVVVLNVAHLAFDGISVAVDDGFRSYDTIGRRLTAHNFELDGSHSTSHHEHVILVDGTVGFQKVWFKECLEQVAGQTFDGVVKGQNVNPLSILYVGTRLDRDDVGEVDAQIIADNPIHTDPLVWAVLVGEYNTDRLLFALAFEQDRVTTE